MRVLVLRVGEKGGYDDGIHTGWCRTDKSCAGSIAAHPCKKRKEGAPSVGMMQCKDGRPASKTSSQFYIPALSTDTPWRVALPNRADCSRASNALSEYNSGAMFAGGHR